MKKIKLNFKKLRFDFKKIKIDLPKSKKELYLAIALGITVAYLLIGLIFSWSIYINGNISPKTTTILKVYPFPAARVGTTFIPMSRYIRDLEAFKKYGEVSGTQDKYAGFNFETETIERLIDIAIYERVARRYNVSVSKEEVETAYNESVAGETEPVEHILEKYYGFTPADYLVWVEETILKEKVISQVPKKRDIQHILISVDDVNNEEEMKQAEEKAKQLFEELKNGGNFGEIAKRDSNDLSTRDNEGKLGLLEKGTAKSPIIDVAFQDAAFSATLNEITEPVKTSRGWHIILVTAEEGVAEGNIYDIINEEKQKTTISNYVP